MPIFEYVCQRCRKQFEAIVQGSTRPECPKCHSRDLRRQLSVFAVGKGGSGVSNRDSFGDGEGACSTCGDPRGPGSCDLD
ncbi:MAG TPA: zinc ribbon domain-containing protein [Candidatus Polarisedimenticolaceae bacterium]|nr:zinc ribbon domain-containing protein [Candidatus Polarisedimenticolaceae bacterium]